MQLLLIYIGLNETKARPMTSNQQQHVEALTSGFWKLGVYFVQLDPPVDKSKDAQRLLLNCFLALGFNSIKLSSTLFYKSPCSFCNGATCEVNFYLARVRMAESDP